MIREERITEETRRDTVVEKYGHLHAWGELGPPGSWHESK